MLIPVALTAATLFTPAVTAQDLRLAAEDFTLDGDLAPFESTLSLADLPDGRQLLTITLQAPAPAPPPEFTLRFSVPAIDVDGFWNPDVDDDKQNYWRNRFSSRATVHAPVAALLNAGDRNRLTIAASDALNRLDFAMPIREEDARFHVSIGFFAEASPAVERYAVDVLLDTRDVHFAQALGGVADWWAALPGQAPAPVPEGARVPMYSTWYSFHQDLVVEDVLAELRIAKGLGYEAVIVDDGWQTNDSNRGYAYTGDWRPERIPELAAFVQSVHDLGMQFLLWYSLPLVGEKSAAFPRFEGKYLREWGSQGAWVLDPRYPEVRAFVIETYVSALQEWDLDGFKLDFLDFFKPTEETVLTAEDGRDHASVNAAVDRLMTDLIARLRAIRPDILIEFRQRYTGPLMRKYGNMFRGVDCPDNSVANRIETTDLRLISGTTAVHSDMLMWHADEPVASAAQQLLAVLFSVPQLSVRLVDIPDDHRAMIGFYTAWWRENRDVLLDGEFRPSNPMGGYPLLAASDDTREIVALYDERVVNATGERSLQVVNATHGSRVVVRFAAAPGERTVRVFTPTGELIDERTLDLAEGLHEFEVPPSGLMRIE